MKSGGRCRTLIVFFLARKLAARFKFPLLNPLLVAMVVIIPFCC
jgi:putative effector of murein hydrolase